MQRHTMWRCMKYVSMLLLITVLPSYSMFSFLKPHINGKEIVPILIAGAEAAGEAVVKKMSKAMKDPELIGDTQEFIQKIIIGSFTHISMGVALSATSFYIVKTIHNALTTYFGSRSFEIIKSPNLFRQVIDSLLQRKSPKLTDLTFDHAVSNAVLSYQKILRHAQKKQDSLLSNLLLYGPPGTGKTEIAKRIARESGKPFIGISGSSFSKYQDGESIAKMDEIIAWARSKKAIIIIDEIEVLLPNRKDIATQSKEKHLVTNFLAHLSTFSKDICIIGATNHIEAIDTAALQRFAFKINVPLPSVRERSMILNYYIQNHILAQKDFSIQDNFLESSYITTIAQQTEGFSGRELENICIIAAQKATTSPSLILTKEIFQSSIDTIRAQ